MYLSRELIHQINAWKKRKNRKPLLLKGARQVGKTSLLLHVGSLYFEDVAYFSFEQNTALAQLFEDSIDVKRLLDLLAVVHGKAITPEKTLLIFDEIQACAQALNSLKYFAEQAPDLHVAAAGSLLGITLGKNVSFPVGKVEFLEVNPLSFSEFLAASDPSLHTFYQSIAVVEPLPKLLFGKLLDQFRFYLICGGMPEPITAWLESKDIERVQKLQHDILLAYSFDFAKHPLASQVAKIQQVWQSIPSQLARENRKFLYQTIKPGARAREFEEALQWLVQAGLVYKVFRTSDVKLPISAYDDLSAFKVYALDCGLLRQQAGLNPQILLEASELFVEFKGALMENYILTALLNTFQQTPRYWNSDGKAEIDFLLEIEGQILPIEVKSSESVKSKSLQVYKEKFDPSLSLRFSLKNLEYNGKQLNIPLFLADRTKDFVSQII